LKNELKSLLNQQKNEPPFILVAHYGSYKSL
jgi:hypothetical protein